MRRRIATPRWADGFCNADWRFGVERGWLEDMAAYWANEFDWRAQEAAMNRFPHFKVEIEGVVVHFMHIRGKGNCESATYVEPDVAVRAGPCSAGDCPPSSNQELGNHHQLG